MMVTAAQQAATEERRRVVERLEECGVEPAEAQRMATSIMRRVRRSRASGKLVCVVTEAHDVPEDLRRTIEMLNELAAQHPQED